MKRTFIRVLSLVLCLIMMVAIFAACDDKGKGGIQTTTTTPPQGTTPPTGGTTSVEIDPEWGVIPEDVDYGGETYQLLLWANAKGQLFPEAMVEGEDIRNDLYLRNQAIEEYLGMKFDTTFMQSHGSGAGGDELYNHALEGRIPYVGICAYSIYPPKLALEGLLADMNSLEYPYTEMAWYPKQIAAWEIKDRLFFLANNSSVRNILANWCIYANNVMIESKGLEEIADVVLDGRWTLDTLRTYSRNWDSEAQGNASKVEADRVYGFTIVHCTAIQAFYHAAGFQAARRNAEGEPEFAFFGKTDIEQTSAFVDKFLDICKDSNFGYGDQGMYNGNWTAPLANENAAFYAGALDMYTRIDEDGTWTIIPLPKLTEEQTEYYTIQNYAFDVWCIPEYAKDIEVGGLIIEATSYNDYAEIARTFYDYDFKYRYSADDRGVQIFDLIRTSFYADFARAWSIGGPYQVLKNCLSTGVDRVTLTNTYATSVGGLRTSCQTALRNLNKLIDELFPEG